MWIYDLKSVKFMAIRWPLPMQPIYRWKQHDLNFKVQPSVGRIEVMVGCCGCSKLGTISMCFIFKFNFSQNPNKQIPQLTPESSHACSNCAWVWSWLPTSNTFIIASATFVRPVYVFHIWIQIFRQIPISESHFWHQNRVRHARIVLGYDPGCQHRILL